jgi:alpha-beta hydrolase superfamily lysophospholipase
MLKTIKANLQGAASRGRNCGAESPAAQCPQPAGVQVKATDRAPRHRADIGQRHGLGGLAAWLRRACLAMVLAQLGACAWMDQRQRELIYRPTAGSLSQWQAITPQDEALWLQPRAPRRPDACDRKSPQPVTQDPLRAMWVPQADPRAPTVLYFHGTLRNVFQNRHKIEAIHRAGFSVLAVDYRGYGESPAWLPCEASILEDAELVWEEFERREPRTHQRVVFGHSMGSGVAVEMALRKAARGQPPRMAALVIESPFTSMPDIASDYNWVGWLFHGLTTQHFRSIDKIDSIEAPIWILSGTADRTVPSMHAQRLFEKALPPKHLRLFQGGTHSSLQAEFDEAYQGSWLEVRELLKGQRLREQEGTRIFTRPRPSPTAPSDWR